MCQVDIPPLHKRRLGTPVLVKIAGVGPTEAILKRLEEIEAESSDDAENSESFGGSAFIARLRYALRARGWLLPLARAVVCGVIAFFTTPVPTRHGDADKLTTAYQALLAVGLTLALAAFALQRTRLNRMKPALLGVYAICAVVSPLLGGVLSLPHGFFDHVWGAPLLLAFAVAGSVGIFLTMLISWAQGNS